MATATARAPGTPLQLKQYYTICRREIQSLFPALVKKPGRIAPARLGSWGFSIAAAGQLASPDAPLASPLAEAEAATTTVTVQSVSMAML